MKKLIRMFVFSALALYLTSLWNQGFLIELNWQTYIKATFLIVLIYYLIVPLSKLILLPLNILTFGLVSAILYCFLFYFLTNYFSLINIKAFTFEGIKLFSFNLDKINVIKNANILVSALSVSTIINLLEKIL